MLTFSTAKIHSKTDVCQFLTLKNAKKFVLPKDFCYFCTVTPNCSSFVATYARTLVSAMIQCIKIISILLFCFFFGIYFGLLFKLADIIKLCW